MEGPFNHPAFPDCIISPLSLRTKKDPGKFLLLHDLSFPYDHSSINSGINEHFSSVKYQTVENALKLILKFGRGCYLAKTDIKSAFRLIPTSLDEYRLLIFKFQNQYYFDRNLAMRCRSSCRICEEFSSAIQWVLENKLHIHGSS